MRVSLGWLLEYVSLDPEPLLGVRERWAGTPGGGKVWDLEALADGLTMMGLEVENIERRGEEPHRVVVGRIQAVAPHPRADNLWVVRADVGQGSLEVVCGATNLALGQLVPVALPGAVLPGGRGIEGAEIRGVLSQGMLCSAFEIGLADREDRAAGILVLDSDLRPGQDIREALGLRDIVFELSLTPNYASHCQSMLGVAREVAALTGAGLRFPWVEVPAGGGDVRDPVKIRLDDPERCPRYTARMIGDLQGGPSPFWMQQRLRAAGVRPINQVVDVTNYVMLELGQPLHAFDWDLVAGGIIVVRLAREGETIVTLDGVERSLAADDLLIADRDRGIGIAGVMGGANTEVSATTTTVLLESAHFDPAGILRTSRRLGLRTEASNRFEKVVDPNGTDVAADRAMELLVSMGAGTVMGGVVDVYPRTIGPKKITVRPWKVNGLLGTRLETEDLADLYRRFGFGVQIRPAAKAEAAGGDPGPGAGGGREVRRPDDRVLEVEVPTRRPDLGLEVDLAEEAARLYGYNHIEDTLPVGRVTAAGLKREQRLTRLVKAVMVAVGFSEVVTLSFSSPAAHQRARVPVPAGAAGLLPLANPMTEEHSHVRVSLLPGLLETASYNVRRRNDDLAVFELGRVYLAGTLPPGELPLEPLRLAGVSLGEVLPRNWGTPGLPAGFYFLKGALEEVLAVLGLGAQFVPTEHPSLHPGRAARVLVGPHGHDSEREVGVLGEVHPQVAAAYDLPGRPCLFEVDYDLLQRLAVPIQGYRPLPRFPAVRRDVALVVDRGVAAARALELIREAGGGLLESAELFDVFEGRQIPAGKRSLAFALVYRSPDRTLTDAEVDDIHAGVRRRLAEELGADLRS